MSNASTVLAEPLFHALAIRLRDLQPNLRQWLDGSRRYPLAEERRQHLHELAEDLTRKADDLESERSVLVVMLMGGTGVGKSSLLNALAGSPIAQSSHLRPTTRDAVVYYHESLSPKRLAPALHSCRLVPHNKAELAQKVLVDTPDFDSNDLANREVLSGLLHAADVVLYVGSQEKYHDQLGWDLFRRTRSRRAFAFVLNKWDRCQDRQSGKRPDEDLLRDLQAEGFDDPLLFRTCAQMRIDQANGNGSIVLPEGEQFDSLVEWLQTGLHRLEIEAIKARGVGQLLQQIDKELVEAAPPDLRVEAQSTHAAWSRLLAEEAEAAVPILLNTLEPYQREIEHYFTVQGQQRFRGIMAAYLRLVTGARYWGSKLSARLSLFPRSQAANQPNPSWDLATFMKACSAVAVDRHLEGRSRALPDRLLVEADLHGFPLRLLSAPTEAVAEADWRQRYGQLLAGILQDVQEHWSRPTGLRRAVHAALAWLADWIPGIAFLGACIRLLWLYFMTDNKIQLFDALIPVIVLVLVLFLLHMVILLVMPMRWPAIRGDFQRRLGQRVEQELESAYGVIPGEVAQALAAERDRVEAILEQTRAAAQWLGQQEQANSVAALYGN